jgi:hypothetical protein
VAVEASEAHWCRLQQRAALHNGGAGVLTSLSSKRAVEMACEHPRLTLVLAVLMVEAEGGGKRFAMCDRAARRRSATDTTVSAATRRR